MIHLWFPTPHTYGKLLKVAKSIFKDCKCEPGNNYFSFAFDLREDGEWPQRLFDSLSFEERASTHGVLLPKGTELGVSHFRCVRSLEAILAGIRGQPLLDLLKEDRLTTWFQPIFVAGESRAIFGYECLLRGLDDTGEIVPPGPLLCAAKEAGVLYSLDLLARRTAVQSAAKHGLTSNIFINFSPASIYDPDFCLRSTIKLIEELALAPRQIVFEVTEAEKPQDIKHLRRITAYYKERGFRVALDDMGEGYSSLNLIHQLSPDFIKLDRNLVDGVTKNSMKQEIAGALLAMCVNLNIKTIAEGIETKEEGEWLKQHGADYLQGYYFARPAPYPVSANDSAAN